MPPGNRIFRLGCLHLASAFGEQTLALIETRFRKAQGRLARTRTIVVWCLQIGEYSPRRRDDSANPPKLELPPLKHAEWFIVRARPGQFPARRCLGAFPGRAKVVLRECLLSFPQPSVPYNHPRQ